MHLQALYAAMNDAVARGLKQHRWVLVLCAICVHFSDARVPLHNDCSGMARAGDFHLLWLPNSVPHDHVLAGQH